MEVFIVIAVALWLASLFTLPPLAVLIALFVLWAWWLKSTES